MPDRPYGESLAIRTASSSPSWAMTVSTGPKISSRATLRVVVEAGDHGRLDEEAGVAVGGTSTAAGERAALGDRRVQVALDAVALPRRDHRAADGAGVGRIARLEPGHRRRRRLDGLVVAGPRHHQAGGDRAALAGVHRRGERRHRARAGEIGVVEHQERRLAAEFEEHLLQRRGAVGHHGPARVRRPGERHHVDARILRQQRTDAVVAGGDDVDDAGREVGVLDDQLAEHRCAPRGVGCGLEHDGVAGRQRGPELGEVDLVREVPRRDGADDADGLPRDRAVRLDAHRRRDAEIGCPLVGLRGVGAEAQILDRALELRHRRQHPRRADLGDRQLPQLLDVVAHRLLQLPDAAHPQLDVGRPVGVVERARAPPRSPRPCRRRVASAATPSTSSVAGLTVGNVPPLPATSLPSMSSRLSRSPSSAIRTPVP